MINNTATLIDRRDVVSIWRLTGLSSLALCAASGLSIAVRAALSRDKTWLPEARRNQAVELSKKIGHFEGPSMSTDQVTSSILISP